MAYTAKIVLDSVNEAGDRLTTMEVTMPWAIVAMFNTYRELSTSLVVYDLLDKQLELAKHDPYVPVNPENTYGYRTRNAWSMARVRVIELVETFQREPVGRETLHLLLAPFTWCTVVVTATHWDNFFALYGKMFAPYELRAIAIAMKEAYDKSEPTVVDKDDWHLPYIHPEERDGSFEHTAEARKISIARCDQACSDLTGDSKYDIEYHLVHYNNLVGRGNFAPFEHVARPAIHWFNQTPHHSQEHWVSDGFVGNFKGWRQYNKFFGDF